MLTFIVTGQELIRIDKVNVASLSQKYLKCRFIFDTEWNNITTKTAIFYDSTGNASYKKILDNDNTCIADSRALQNGSFTVTVYGTKEDDSEFVITTNKVLVKMNASGFIADSDNTEETNPDLIEQVVIKYLNDHAGGAFTPEELQEAVNKYLDENPIEGAGEINVQADWNQTDSTKDDYIKNKPAVLNGQDGKDGADGRGIVSITKTSSAGLIDVYTITYTDNTTSTFTVTNGKDGSGTGTGGTGADGVGIAGISKTSTSGLVDTYTITYTDGNTSTFEVVNGAPGQDGTNGKSLEFNWDGTKLGVRQEGDSEYVFVDLKGADGKDGVSPTITENTNTDTEYTLKIKDKNGEFVTPNLRGGAGEITPSSKVVNPNNIIPASVLNRLTKDSTVQINGEDTYILSSTSVNLYSAAVTDNRKFYVGVWVNEDTYTQYGSELSLNVKRDGTWKYAVMSKTISAANTPEYLELEVDLSPDITDFSITLNAANKNIYFNSAIVVEGVAKQEYYYDSEYWSEVQQHNLFNKMIVGFGDSIMQGVGNGKKGFLEKLTTHTLNACGVMNKGIGGATVSYTADTTNSYLMKQITGYFENFDADIAVINGGVNEAWSTSTYELGEISEGYEAELDTTTFAGALEEIFRYFKVTKQVNVIYMTTHKISGADGLKKRMDLALKICNKWGIGVIDFYNAGQIIADIGDTVNNMYFYNGDGCHPNDAGYEFLRPQFEAGLLNCGQSTHVDTELYKSSSLRSLTLEPNTLYDLGTLSDVDELELTVNMTTASRTDLFHAFFVAGATDQSIVIGASDDMDLAYKGVTEFVIGDTYEISIQNYTIIIG